MSDPDSHRALIASSHLGTLATIRSGGRPQLSMVSHDYDPSRDVIRVSITDGRAKTANLRRDPRASYLVANPAGWGYAVAECRAELLPVAATPDDASVDELVAIYRAISGEHPDWDEYRHAMVADHRIPLLLHIERMYGAH